MSRFNFPSFTNFPNTRVFTVPPVMAAFTERNKVPVVIIPWVYMPVKTLNEVVLFVMYLELTLRLAAYHAFMAISV